MHSPAAALAWEFWARHRWGLAGVGALVAGFALASAVGSLSANLASISSIWLAMGLCYVTGVFAYGFDGRLESAESGFPARLFLLPVSTRVLVGWPMIQGMVIAVLLWLAWDYSVLRPSGIDTPWWWAVMLAAVVATSQAIAWLPFGLPWVRILVAVAVLSALVRAPAILALAGEEFRQPETQARVLGAFAAVLIPVAFLVAWAGVSRARRGDNPDWLRAWQSAGPLAISGWGPRPFRSALGAQVWYEWRTRGLGFVVTVALVLTALAAMGALLERDPGRQAGFGVVLLLVPPLIAPFWSSYAGTAGVSVRSAQLSAFAATRPLGNAGFVRAKLVATGVTALAAWLATLVAWALWLLYTGGYRQLGAAWDAAVAENGAARVAAACVLLAVGPALVTWRALAVGLWSGLTGRAWVPLAQTLVLSFLGLQLMYEWTLWNADTVRRERILAAVPWVAGAAVILKFVVAGWALGVLYRRRQCAPRAVAGLLALWSLAAAGVLALFIWLAPPDFAPLYGMVLGVVLFVPLARLVIAPLALAWNRHR